MAKTIKIDDLRTHLENAREKLSLEKLEILKLYPLAAGFNREEYAFAYVRTERLGLDNINQKLAEIAWLPMQLDPRAEIVSENRHSMKRWLTSMLSRAPDSQEFGNDFMHTLARCAMKFGWEKAEFTKLSGRIADLFRDLSCLIGLIYYCTWLGENNVESVELSDPDNLNRTASEISALIQSPELYNYLREQQKIKAANAPKKKSTEKPKKKSPPALHVIENKNYSDPFMPDPAYV